MKRALAGVVAWAMVGTLLVPTAWASLGSDSASVEADRVKMQGTLQSRTSEAFTVHEIQVATGTAVREYVSPAGKVFAVTWNGPFHPDLR